MKNIKIVLLLFFVFALAGCDKRIASMQDGNDNKTAPKTANDYPVSSAEQIADKLEVYYFHRTQRCYSCNTIGQYIKETMEQEYGRQIKDGLIDFRELNVELLKNKEIARKFRASGSSLFINRIINGQDNIEQDTSVWRLLSDEEKFKSYLENKIDSYLGL